MGFATNVVIVVIENFWDWEQISVEFPKTSWLHKLIVKVYLRTVLHALEVLD